MGSQASGKHVLSVVSQAVVISPTVLIRALLVGMILLSSDAVRAQPPATEPAPAPKPPEATAPKPPAAAPAPQPPAKRFYEQDPYDVLILNKANDNAQLKVMPLDLPDQRMPPKNRRIGKISVFLLESPESEYEVTWRDIERVDFFGDLVLVETNKLLVEALQLGAARKQREAQAKFDEVFAYHQYLRRFYPKTAGLDASFQRFLYVNAGSLYQRQRIAEAVALLKELYRIEPQYQQTGGQSVLVALDRLGGLLVSGYIDNKDYRSARVLLERFQKEFGTRLPGVMALQSKLIEIATSKRDQAAAYLKAQKYQQAYDTVREVLMIWPSLEGGRELALEISRQYPLAIVGVSRPALKSDPASLDDTAARRSGVLRYATLMQYVDRGTDGGKYRCPFGQVEQSDDRSEMVFTLRSSDTSQQYTGYDLSRFLIELADPSSSVYRASWASLVESIQVEQVMNVRVRLQRPHVLPQAMLQLPLTEANLTGGLQYKLDGKQGNQTRFAPTVQHQDPDKRWPVVVERHYDDPRAVIRAIRDGKIDVIDRVLPTDALRLMKDDTVQVGAYAFPSIHVLAPNTDNPYLDNRHFRRALVLAINRSIILNKGLLNDQELEGCQVISAPIPAGVTSNDPAGYAYDHDIEPYPYDPVLASILKSMAETQMAAMAEKKAEIARKKAEENGQPAPDEEEAAVPELKPLVLAHPATEMARFVCLQIQEQLKVAAIECTLTELPPGQCHDPKREYDLLFIELTMREPLIDVERIFGPDGVIPSTSPYVRLALRQLSKAKNWPEARNRLHDLHRLITSDATAIPLWQIVDHYVHRKGMQGLRNHAVFLYESVDQWRMVPPEWKE